MLKTRAKLFYMVRRPAARAAAALAAGLLASGCAASQTRGGDAGYVSGLGEITSIPAAQRQPVPSVSGTTLAGKQVNLSDYKGKIVVLNIWGSWCPPCREEAPDLEQAYKETAAQGVVFLGINTRDTTAGANDFDRTHGITYDSINDPDGTVVLALKKVVPYTAIPSTVVIDRQGRIAVRAITQLTESQVTAFLAPIIAER